MSKHRESSYERSAKSCCYGKLHCCSRERRATARLQIHSSRGKRATAQLKVVSLSSANGGVTSRSRRGSRSLLNPSNCAAHSKYMSTKLLTPSQSWIIRCGPRIPMVRHIFCASVSRLAHWSVVAPQEFLEKDYKNNFVSRYGQAWSGAEGGRGIHDLGGWQHLYAFPSPESKPGLQPAGKTLRAVNRIEKQQLQVTKIELWLESCGICRLRK